MLRQWAIRRLPSVLGSGKQIAAMGSAGQTYLSKVLAAKPANLIALWPLTEKSGLVADNAEGTAARDGTYSAGATLNSVTFSNGEGVASFDGNDDINVYSASFNTAFNKGEFTVLVWGKVANASVWSDGVDRFLTYFTVDATNNIIDIQKSAVSDTVNGVYKAGGTAKQATATLTTTGWFSLAITVSVIADEFRLFVNGIQSGATQTGLGTWAGDFLSGRTQIGSRLTGGTNGWNGALAYVACWDTPLTPAEVLNVATI